MSVINQVLYNLEKRRVSPGEQGLLPEHVRVMPGGRRVHHWGWAAVGMAFAVAAPAGWVAFTTNVAGPKPARDAAGDEGVKVVAMAGADSRTYFGEPWAFRLSLELANLPEAPAPHRGTPAPKKTVAKELLSSARLIDRKIAASKAAPKPAAVATVATSTRSKASRTAAPVETVAGNVAQPGIHKQVHDPTARELSRYRYRNAVALLNQKRPAEAEEGFRTALELDPENQEARQALVGLLVQANRLEEAEGVLEEAVKLSPKQTGFYVTLARLQAHRGDNTRAIATLEKGLEHAQGSAEYAAFLATLLQREGQHEKAIEQFQAALRARPNVGVWWVGLGVSLQAANHPEAAADAYRQARATGNLHPHLAALAEQRLRQLH